MNIEKLEEELAKASEQLREVQAERGSASNRGADLVPYRLCEGRRSFLGGICLRC